MTKSSIQELTTGQILRHKTIKGLHVRALKSKKVFYLYYRTKSGIERRPKLANVNDISIHQAQLIAKELLKRVAAGNDPSLTIKNLRSSPTTNEAFNEMMINYWARFSSEKWQKEVEGLYNRRIKSRFGGEKLNEISPQNIEKWHGDLKPTPTEANRALSILNGLWNRSKSMGLENFNTNPCLFSKRFKEAPRGRYASPEELTQIIKTLMSYEHVYPQEVAFIFLLIYTGSRPSYIERACLNDFNPHTSSLTLKGKSGQESVTVPTLALPYIFKGLGVKAHKVKKVWGKIRDRVGCKDLWLRDLRRTFATVGLSGGEDMSKISEVLNHKSQQTTKIYAKLFDEKKETMVNEIAERIKKLTG